MASTPTPTPASPFTAAATLRLCIWILCILGTLAIFIDYDSPQAAGTAPTVASTSQPAEDEAGFDCRIHGNQVCGPDASIEAGFDIAPGCYTDGKLTTPWRDGMSGLGRGGCILSPQV